MTYAAPLPYLIDGDAETKTA